MNNGLKYFVLLLVVAVALVAVQFVYRSFSSNHGTAPHPLLESTFQTDAGQSSPQKQAASQPEKTESVITPEMVKERENKLRQEIVRKRKEADALEARKHDAFMKWWHAPAWCLEEEGMKALVQCSDLKRAKRAQFDRLLAEGKITLPPAPGEVTTAP